MTGKINITFERQKEIISSMDEVEKELLYTITKVIAESDSIGEGWSYKPFYSKKDFSEDIREIKQGKAGWSNYVSEAGIIGYLKIKKFLKNYYNIQ